MVQTDLMQLKGTTFLLKWCKNYTISHNKSEFKLDLLVAYTLGYCSHKVWLSKNVNKIKKGRETF